LAGAGENSVAGSLGGDLGLLTNPARFHVLCFTDLFPLVLDMWHEYGPTSVSFQSPTLAAMNVLLVGWVPVDLVLL
jgi:hypothetical protein